MRTIQELISLGESTRREAIGRQLKEQGNKVIGYLCNYVPEEIITAAGAVPYRVLGGISPSTTKAEAYVPSTDCSYCRAWLEVSLEGGYDFLDGLLTINSCANMVRTYDAWMHFVQEKELTHVLSVSRKDTPEAQRWFRTEIIKLIEKLENHLDVKIEPESIRNAITEQNRTRGFLKELYQWRSNGSINAKDALQILEASMLIPKAQFNELFSQAKEEIDLNRDLKDGPRILVSGSMCSNHEFLTELEEAGCNIVADDLCIGSRYFWESVDETIQDPLDALAHRYLVQPPCARMADVEKRINYLQKMIKDFNVEGVIYTPLKNCDVFLTEGPVVQRRLEKEGLPILYLEREHTMSGYGQAKVRIEAFMETLI